MAIFKTSSRIEVQAQDASSLEDLMLEACRPRQSWNDEDKFEEEASPWSMWEHVSRLHQASASKCNQERCSILKVTRSSTSSSSGMLKAKV